DVHRSLRRQAGGIDDGSANIGLPGSRRSRERDMPAAGTVTSLTIDAFGKGAFENRVGVIFLVGRRNLRISVMTKHALVGDLAERVLMIRMVVAGAHPPMAS